MANTTPYAGNAGSHATAMLRVATSGEVFTDGTIIDLVRGNVPPALGLVVSANGKKPKIVSEFEHRGHVYVPAALDSAYLNLIQLPAGVDHDVDIVKLFNHIVAVMQQLTGIESELALLAAYFGIFTWFSDIFSEPPTLIITGPRLPACAVLRALSYFCRRALLVQLLGGGDFGSLPLDCSPTLLIDASMRSRSAIYRLLTPAASNFAIPHHGGLVRFCGAKAVYTGMVAPQIREGGIRLPLAAASNAMFAGAGNRQLIAEQFQSQLLAYRLANYSHVLGSTFDVPGLAFGARALARSLGACLVGDPGLQDGVVSLFEDHSRAEEDENSSDVLACTVEALLVCAHQQKAEVYVGKLAEMVNGILQGRGEAAAISPRELGEKLRILGLTTCKLGRAGRGLRLDRQICDRLHRLGRDYGVRMLDDIAGRFPCCAAIAKEGRSEKPKKCT